MGDDEAQEGGHRRQARGVGGVVGQQLAVQDGAFRQHDARLRVLERDYARHHDAAHYADALAVLKDRIASLDPGMAEQIGDIDPAGRVNIVSKTPRFSNEAGLTLTAGLRR